ncbi:MAG: SDR family NAD(P)-dependent oxidoreductase [Planctomycetota bacterium]
MDDPAPVAIVTGGAKRVGRVVCGRLAERGYRVAVHANTSLDAAEELASQLRKNETDAIALSADLTDEAAARAMLDSAAHKFGRLDLLVNSAAIWRPKPLREVRASDLREYFDVNAVATFVCAQHAGLIMADQPDGGSIVNFGDAAAERPQAGYAAYHPSKGAIPTMTRSLAVELAAINPRVRVNAVLPGPVLVSDDEPEERQQEVTRGVLLATTGHADHLASAVLMLASNQFITGVCVPVEGGRRLGGGW